MRITKLHLSGRGAWPDFDVESLDPQVNVFFGKPGAGKSTIAQLANHLLYGKSPSRWRQQFGQTLPLVEGHLVVESRTGNFVLRRHLDSDGDSRLTITALDGKEVHHDTIQQLLGKVSTPLIASVIAVDFAEAPSVEWLLSRKFCNELSKAGESSPLEFDSRTTHPTDRACGTKSSQDRRRIEELIHQRNRLAESIEKHLSVRRQEGGVLAKELGDLETNLEAGRRRLDSVQAKLSKLSAEISDCETRLRMVSLAKSATQPKVEYESEDQLDELRELEAEISRCRTSMADLQSRQVSIRAKIAQVFPDDSMERGNCLHESRSTIGVLERLLDDLDAEISLLACSKASSRTSVQDSHARLSPVANLLRQQLYSLCGLIGAQERQSHRQRLVVESRQLAQSQLDFSERLEHLLEQRELLTQQLRQVDELSLSSPQTPIPGHCQCDHHEAFLARGDSLLVGYRSRRVEETKLRDRYEALLKQHEELAKEEIDAKQELLELETRWEAVQRERAGLVGNSVIEEQQFELERLEITIRNALRSSEQGKGEENEVWRASDLLAQLSNGQFDQIRLELGGSSLKVLDREGHSFSISELSTATHDQLYLALTLALVGALARRGITLPLTLDEPFLRQNAAGSAAMAGVLVDFARSGHQVLVFTEDLDALRRFEGLDSQIHDLAKLRQSRDIPTFSSHASVLTRVVRETEDGERTPVLQIHNLENLESQYYLAKGSPLSQFPVFGSNTSQIFEMIKLHFVGDLLHADPDQIARDLKRTEITAETVKLWQTHMDLMCGTPGLTLNDAQVLAACGIVSSQQLSGSDAKELEHRIHEFLLSARGRKFRKLAELFPTSRLRKWCENKRVPQQHSTGNGKLAHISIGQNLERQVEKKNDREPRYFLHEQSVVEDCPSIGPKTAQHLMRVGVYTVADLLQADPKTVASQIQIDRITASKIIQWQDQARLVCQIPELRGYAAQLLVACGFNSPEQIAAASLDELVRQIEKLCDSDLGQRILRTSDPPSAEKIRRWAANAARRRPLEAA